MAARNTEQRRIVAQALLALANHPTVDQVYAYVHETHPTISKATVYRCLNKMADEGTATHVRVSDGADHFDHTTGQHYHVRCVECGKIDDVMIPLLDGIAQQAEAATSFNILGHTLMFDGLCVQCQEK